MTRASGANEFGTNRGWTLNEGDILSRVYINIPADTTVDTIIYPQLEQGTTATEYKPYIKPNTLSYPLTQIPLGTTIDFENKKIIDYGVDIILTGEELYNFYNASTTLGGVSYYFPSIYVQILPGNENRVVNAITTDGKIPKNDSEVWGSDILWIGVKNKYLYWLDIIHILKFDENWADKINPTSEE